MIKAHKLERRASFTEGEAEFLAENFLGRVATASPSGQPHVVPVGYRFDGTTISFGGWNLTKSLKYRNLVSNNKVAFVVDEVVSTRPWRVRGVEVRGTAETHEEGGATSVTINPKRVKSWGLEK
jgi:pyridoxamine 5'-phosphate oxidase family protein